MNTDACVEMLPKADSRLNRGFGLHWNLDRKFAQYLMEWVAKKSPQLANTRVEGCEPTGASMAGLDFWQQGRLLQ